MFRMIFVLLLVPVVLCGTAEAALEGLDEEKTYTRQELENLARQQMGVGYEEYQAAKASIPELQKQIETEQQTYKEQQNKLNERVRAGIISDDEYNKQSKELKKTTDERVKQLEKQVDVQEKEIKNFEKEFEKTQKDIDKQLKKQEKAAEKEAKAQKKLEDKATKQNDKLQAAVAECQSMNASPEKRWACEQKAREKYGLSDEQQAALDEKTAREQAEAKAAEEAKKQAELDAEKQRQDEVADEYLKSIMAIEEEDEEPDPLFSAAGNATGSGMKGVCADAGNIFKQVACKAMVFLIDLRILAYVISGFGMVAFAYAAIFNKISWKHFSQIAIGLFMLSMIGPFITYFTGDPDKTVERSLEYGNYLGGKYKPVLGSSDKINCGQGVDEINCLPEVVVTVPAKKWSIKDLKGSIQSGLNLVRSGYNAYQGAKQVVNNVKTEAQNIGNAIKNSGGGLDGVLNAASQVAGAANRLSYDVKTGMNGVAMQVANAANAAQDVTATDQQRKARQNIRVNGNANGGNTTNAVAAWLSASGEGGQMLGQLNQATDTVGRAAAGVGKATTAGHEGQKIGGGGTFGNIVGGIFAAGTAVGEGSGVYYDSQEAAVRAKKQQEDLAAMRTDPGLTPAEQARQQVAQRQALQQARSSSGQQAAVQSQAGGGSQATPPEGGISDEEALRQAAQIRENFAKQQGKAGGQQASATNKAKASAPVQNAPVSQGQPAENKAAVPTTATQQSQGEQIKNSDGSVTTLNEDGSVTLTYANGQKVDFKADDAYSKEIKAYQKDRCQQSCQDVFMAKGAEAHTACMAKCG